MSATEWKFVPVEPTIEMVAALGFDGDIDMTVGHGAISAEIVSAYTNMLDAAPVPPSVESLLENWTPSDQQAFATFLKSRFPAELDSYAIQSLGSAWKDGQANASTEVPQYTGTGSDSLDCILGVGGFASFGPLDAQPAAHLTIPGALEWDGDNGTHGADGESRAYGESEGDHEGRQLEWERCENKRLRALLECSQGDMRQADQIMTRQRVELYNLEQSRRSFFDLSQDLEKRLAEIEAERDDYKSKWLANCEALKLLGIHARHAEKLVKSCREKLEVDSVGKGFIEALDGFVGALCRDDRTHCESVEAKSACSRCGDWGHIETEDSAHDCPECGPSVIERAVEAGVMNAPSKPKTCIECDQPYCHGVCVERGDQDYDRDQAAKGGKQ